MIKEIREILGLRTQDALSKLLNVPASSVSRWERDVHVPTFTIDQVAILEAELQKKGRSLADFRQTTNNT